MSGTLMPRLATGDAVAKFEALRQLLTQGGDPVRAVEIDHPAATPNPTGGRPASVREIESWRQAVVSAVSPSPKPAALEPADFDRYSLSLGEALVQHLGLSAADAAHDGVWSYLSLCVFPDLVHVRWSADSEGRLSPDRWIGAQVGRDRNFLKLCRRNWLAVGPTSSSASNPLGEDELLSMLERTSLARNRRLIAMAAEKILAWPRDAGPRSEFARDLMREVRRWTGSLLLDVLDDRELRELVDEATEAVAATRLER